MLHIRFKEEKYIFLKISDILKAFLQGKIGYGLLMNTSILLLERYIQRNCL